MKTLKYFSLIMLISLSVGTNVQAAGATKKDVQKIVNKALGSKSEVNKHTSKTATTVTNKINAAIAVKAKNVNANVNARAKDVMAHVTAKTKVVTDSIKNLTTQITGNANDIGKLAVQLTGTSNDIGKLATQYPDH